MKIEKLEKKENAVLNRDEVSAQVIFSDATPSRSDIIKALAAATKSKEDLVIVRSLQGNYGGGSATLVAHVYKDRASLENVEREYMRTRNTVKAEEKPAEEPAEEKSEEAPAEDKAEEKTEAKEESAEDSEAKEEAPAEDKVEEKPAESEEKPAEAPAEEKAEEKPADDEKKKEGE